MKRLMVITTSYPEADQTGAAAAGSFVEDLAHELARRVAVCLVAPARTDGIEQNGGLALRRFRVPQLPLSQIPLGTPKGWGRVMHTLRAGQIAVIEAAHAHRPDHVFALWALPSGHWARSLSRRTGVPYSVWTLGSDIWSLGRLPLVWAVLGRVLRDSRHCFSDGLLLRDDTERLGGRHCQFLPSTRRLPVTDVKSLRSAPPYRLAFLGRWHRNKGVDLLLQALSLLNPFDWNRVEAVRIHGGGPMEQHVRGDVQRLVAAGRPVQVGGYLNKVEAADLLAWADYLLIPSRIESIPVVFSDAMQGRCPVLTSPVGDLPRLVHGLGVGVVAERTDAGALACGLRELLARSPAQFQGGMDKALETFDLGRVVERVLALGGE
jgi:glycosyltransferase involved in cell wall biosynthesis